MNGIKLMGLVAVLAALLTGCAENGGLLDASVGVNVGNHRGHHDNGRHEGERRRHGHDDEDD